MPSVFAIVSKKVFEKDAPGLGLGDVWKTTAYLSTHKGLSPLEDGGSLYLVTVRPPDEKLWLVGVVGSPKKKKDGWHGAANEVAITDISSLRSKLVFSTGKGMSQKKGALGMSLQTPRELCAADEQLLQKTIGGASSPAVSKKKAVEAEPAKKKKKNESAKKTSAKAAPSSTPEPPVGPIRYTDEARKYLSPRSAAELPKAKTSKALWKSVREALRNPSPIDLDASVPELGPVLASLEDSEEPEQIDVAGWAPMLVRAHAYNAEKTVGFLVSRVGPVEALKIVIRAHEFALRPTRPVAIVAASDAQPTIPLIQDAIHHGLMRAGAAARDEALEIARAAWARGGHLHLRLTLLSCFPEETAWANEIAREWLKPPTPNFGRDALLRSVTEAEMIERIVEKTGLSSVIVEIVPLLGEDAAPLLDRLLSEKRFPNEQKAISRALACIGTAQSASVFAKHLRKKNVRPYATEFYATFPELAEGALGDLAKKRTKVGGIAKEILERVARSRVLAARDERDLASDDEVPEILRNPPWHSESRPKRKKGKVIEGLPVPQEPTRLHWSDESRRRRISKGVRQFFRGDPEDARAELEAKIEKGEPFYVQGHEPADLLFELLEREPGLARISTGVPDKLLTIHGEKALRPVLGYFERDRVYVPLEILMRMESPRLAARLLRRLGADAGPASLWVTHYPEAAVAGLVPATLSADKAERRNGEATLRFLARLGHGERIRDAAKKLGEEAAKAIDVALSWDERFDCPKKPPKMPSSFRPAELRPPKLKNGKALPEWAVERLGEMLCFSPSIPPYVGLREVREACDPRSVAEFAWDLAQAWDVDGGKESHVWMLHAVEHFGDDEVVRRLTPALGGEGIAKMLGRIATDAAVMELVTIIARVERGGSTPKYAYGMHDAMREAAARRGVEPFELEERLVPTYDVDADGGLELSLGSRAFRVAFDAGLRPVLEDDDGERVKTLPRGTKDDDPEKVKAAHALWTDLQEDVLAIADRRARGACAAMQEGRGWKVDAFREVYLDHPLMIHLARGIVWEARDADDTPYATFRVAEDGTFADVEDEPFALDDRAAGVGVAHPFRMTAEERRAWRGIFDDYEVIQPFDQLGTDPPALSAEDLSGNVVKRKAGRSVDWQRIDQLRQKRGWARGTASSSRLFPGGLFGALSHDHHDQTVSAWALDAEGRKQVLADLDDVVRGELALALQITTDES